MEAGLLVNLSRYAPSEKSAPIENFITEAFAWLLRHDSEVQHCVLELIKSKRTDHDVISFELENELQISTQVNFNGLYPDMQLTSKAHGWTLVFEHKVWSELHHNQLDGYRDYAKQHFSRFALVLITARSSQHQQRPDIALCWHEIAKKINGLGNHDEKQAWLRQEFISLLDAQGLLDITPINPLSLNYYHEVKKVDGQLTSICKAAMNHSWALVSNKTVTFELAKKVRSAWGRIGLEFVSPPSNSTDYLPWEPGLFCGFFIHGDDVNFKEEMRAGPLAAVTLSIDSSLHDKLHHSKHYAALVNELQDKLGQQPIWTLSDRSKVANSNQWHPIIIHCPISHFYKTNLTLDRQEQSFVEQMNQIQQHFADCPSFQLFCNEMKAVNLEPCE